MANLKQKIECEQRFRKLIEEGGLPAPDRIEYGYTCIRAIWEDRKLAVRIDIDKDPDYDYEAGAYRTEDAA